MKSKTVGHTPEAKPLPWRGHSWVMNDDTESRYNWVCEGCGIRVKRRSFADFTCRAAKSSALDVPIEEIVKEARRRLRIGGGCWRDRPRSAWTRERKLAH